MGEVGQTAGTIEFIRRLKKESGWGMAVCAVAVSGILLAMGYVVYKYIQLSRLDETPTKTFLLVSFVLFLFVSFLFAGRMLCFYLKLHALYSLRIGTCCFKTGLRGEYIAKEEELSVQQEKDKEETKRYLDALRRENFLDRNKDIDLLQLETGLYIKRNFVDRLINTNDNDKREKSV